MSTWMVVEDEPDIYEVLLAMFEMWGIEGVAFVDGEEAIAWIEDVDAGRFQGDLPELAMLDIRLPGDMNGIDVGERIRQSPVLGNIAILLTTAYKLNPKEQEEAMHRTGADKWLPKPLPKFNELQIILESVIKQRREGNNTQIVEPPAPKPPAPAKPAPQQDEPQNTSRGIFGFGKRKLW